jgi:hypothetical protein
MQINKAKIIIECLITSEGIDLKFEEAFCLFLLGLVCFYQFNSKYYSCCYDHEYIYTHTHTHTHRVRERERERESTTEFFINVVFFLGHRG